MLPPCNGVIVAAIFRVELILVSRHVMQQCRCFLLFSARMSINWFVQVVLTMRYLCQCCRVLSVLFVVCVVCCLRCWLHARFCRCLCRLLVCGVGCKCVISIFRVAVVCTHVVGFPMFRVDAHFGWVSFFDFKPSMLSRCQCPLFCSIVCISEVVAMSGVVFVSNCVCTQFVAFVFCSTRALVCGSNKSWQPSRLQAYFRTSVHGERPTRFEIASFVWYNSSGRRPHKMTRDEFQQDCSGIEFHDNRRQRKWLMKMAPKRHTL